MQRRGCFCIIRGFILGRGGFYLPLLEFSENIFDG